MPQPTTTSVLGVRACNAAVTTRRTSVVHIHLAAGYRTRAIHRQHPDISGALAIRIHASEAEREGLGAAELLGVRNLRDARTGAIAIGFDHLEVAVAVENNLEFIRIISRR